jgi:hypothetical protein
LADPSQELAQEEKAPVVGRLSRARALLVRGQVVDDRRLLEDVSPVRFRPLEQVVDRDPVRHDRAPALLLGLEPTHPVVARLPKRETACPQPNGLDAEFAEAGGEDDEGRPVVRCGAGVHEGCLERGERGAIGVRVRSSTRGFAALCRLVRDGFRVGV